MPKYMILSYAQMEEHLGFQAKDYDEDPAQHCGFGMGEEKVREKAAKEKKESPEEEWSISTLLTDWDSMFKKYPQLSSRDTYSNEYNVMCAKGMEGPSVQIYPKLAQLIFNSKANTSQLGKTNGILDIYGMMAGIKEEKWAEMPEFAHYAKVLLHRCNLPLPTPRKDAPTRANAEIAYRNSIETDAPSPKNLDAMLGILAVKEPFRGMKEAYLPYQQTPEYAKTDRKNMSPMYEVDAHPILTAAKTYELRQNRDLMAFLDTPEAVKAAKAGTLYETVQEEVLNPAAAERRREQREAEELRRKEEERQRKEQEAKQKQEEEGKRNQALKEKRSASLRGMLERLGVSEADLKKKPSELRLSGSREYNNMARAALEAYQAASGSGTYSADLDKNVREACFAYTKGKKSVRFFESGRKRFEACLELMMSVSEPNEKGEFPEGIEAQFARINTVRKTKLGDPNYVSPKYYKYDKNQLTVMEAINGLSKNPRVFTDGKFDRKKYDFVVKPLMEAMPKLPNGKPDPDAIVDGKTFQDCFDPKRAEKPDLLQQALNAYDEQVEKERKQLEEKQAQEKNAKLQALDALENYRKMSPEDQKAYLKADPNRLESLQKTMEVKRLSTDQWGAKNVQTDGKADFLNLLNGMLGKKQAAADAKANEDYHSPESCSARRAIFDARQDVLNDAWKGYDALQYPDDYDRYYRNMQRDYGNKSCISVFRDAIHNAAEKKDKLDSLKAELEKRRQAAEGGKDKQTAEGGKDKQISDREKAALEKMEKDVQKLQEDAEMWACRAYACRKVHKPDEMANSKSLRQMTTKLLDVPGMGSSLLESIVQDKNKTVATWHSKSKSFQNAQNLFHAAIREDAALAPDIKVPALPQTLCADDVYQQLNTIYSDAVKKCTEEKQKFEETELQRKQQCEKDNLPYLRNEIPEALHKARDMAVRVRVAGYLVPQMYKDKNDQPNLKDLNEKTKSVVEDSSFMESIVYQDIDANLEQLLKTKCSEYLNPKKDAELSNSASKEEQKQVSAEPKAKNKKNNKMGLG